ncbi:MAG: response regulator [Betaproteobacteria bacterium]
MDAAAAILNARILIVDDTPANVLLLEILLHRAGHTRVESTTDPNAVCELHRKNQYDLILLDLQMPGIDGFQVMEGLKEIEKGGYLPVIVITGMPEKKLRALKAGAKDFLSKPFDLAELMARVRNVLEVRRLHMETKRLYDELLAEHKRLIELSAQPGAMVGVKKDERLATPWYLSLRLRLPWLQLNLLAAFVAAGVVGLFQETIDRLLILTMFLPVLAGQSGNTGSQALAVTLRGVFLGELDLVKERALVMKEALLGLLNGALVGLVAAICMFVVAAVKHMPNALMLSVVVFLAMIGSCVISGALGAVMPLMLKKLGADPVIASSIFLTTATNVASMGLLLGLATVLVK